MITEDEVMSAIIDAQIVYCEQLGQNALTYMEGMYFENKDVANLSPLDFYYQQVSTGIIRISGMQHEENADILDFLSDFLQLIKTALQELEAYRA